MSRALRMLVLALLIAGGGVPQCEGGMPSPLPTNWTADNSSRPGYLGGPFELRRTNDARWQALSFFGACVAVSAWAFRAVWNALRRDFPRLPVLNYRRSLGLIVLWGLGFVLVLTMISGARELMTPGAWKQQGWTYRLTDVNPSKEDLRLSHEQALEKLRFALWQQAAMHAGRFPSEGDPAIDPELWSLPGGTGLRFLYRTGLEVESAGRLLAFEPNLDGPDRLVLLTNGFIGRMRTSEIDRLLEKGNEETP